MKTQTPSIHRLSWTLGSVGALLIASAVYTKNQRRLRWKKLNHCVDLASDHSFPASDAPSYSPPTGVGSPH